MFRSTLNKGFQITFDNGNTVSVQWGPGNYCEKRHTPIGAPMSEDFWESETAEVAAWDDDGNWHRFEYDSVEGSLAPDEVIKFISFVSSNKLNVEGDE